MILRQLFIFSTINFVDEAQRVANITGQGETENDG